MTEWFVDQDWHYFHYPLDEPVATFPGFEGILSLWRFKGGNDLPAWSDFDFLEFEGWWGWLSVYDVVNLHEPRFKVRLWGTRIADLTGLDPSGEVLTPGSTPSTVDAASITLNDLLFTAMLCREGRLGHTYGPQKPSHGQHAVFHELYLPLSVDGGTIDQIMLAGRSERQ